MEEKTGYCQQSSNRQKEKSANDNTYIPFTDCLSLAPFKKTQKNVHKFLQIIGRSRGKQCMGIRTIKTYWNAELIDIDGIVRELNEEIQPSYVERNVKERLFDHS